MKRRDFIKRAAIGASAPIFLGGMPVRLMSNTFTQFLEGSEGDRVLVMLQLAGGNDGLNTLIPLNQYSEYVTQRENIAIPESGSRRYIDLDSSLPGDKLIGLHPDTTDFKSLYEDAKALFIQNVGYENMNLSHFRGRDIWFMGGGAQDYFPSGWMGRFLESSYPGYPDEYPNVDMPDPLGLEFGYTQSLLFHRAEGIPAGIAITDPDTFYQLVTGVGIDPPAYLPDSYAGEEMKYLIDIEAKSNQYADRLKEIYDAGVNATGVEYPTTYPFNAPSNVKNNNLSWQLKIVARLLSGGIKTRVFLVKIDGFDTHAGQVVGNDPTMGVHAALLYHVSTAVKAFTDDLSAQGIESRVLTCSTSEFGRRVYSNASLGTDHGKAAPVFLFGSGVKAGIMGSNPDLQDLDNGNLKFQYDYRQIYTSILLDWLGASTGAIEASKFEDYIDTRLDIINSPFNVPENQGLRELLSIENIYPNPATDWLMVDYTLPQTGKVVITLMNSKGLRTGRTIETSGIKGKNGIRIPVHSMAPGLYILHLNFNGQAISRKVMITGA
jgi:uncharacterized protein (DUF1501 family)